MDAVETGNKDAGEALDRICKDWNDEIEDDEAETVDDRIRKSFI